MEVEFFAGVRFPPAHGTTAPPDTAQTQQPAVPGSRRDLRERTEAAEVKAAEEHERMLDARRVRHKVELSREWHKDMSDRRHVVRWPLSCAMRTRN